MLGARAVAHENGSPTFGAAKRVIMLYLHGGHPQQETFDPKPAGPSPVRGEFGAIETSVAGVRFSEVFPQTARLMHKLSLIRSVDCSSSNHTPITMQAGNPLARRTNDNRDGGGYPSMGSVAAKFRGANAAAVPAFIGLADKWAADIWGAGQGVGQIFDAPPAAEIVARLKAEYEAARAALLAGETVPTRLKQAAE